MPRSSPGNRKPILEQIATVAARSSGRPLRVLDLGIGHGTYGRLLRESGLHVELTGVEVWSRYRNRRWDNYDHIVEAEISQFLGGVGRSDYDVVLLIDVLEHFDRETGASVLEQVLAMDTLAVIVSTPTTRFPQRAWYGNQFEVHRHCWSDEELADRGLRLIRSSWVATAALWPPFARLGLYIASS